MVLVDRVQKNILATINDPDLMTQDEEGLWQTARASSAAPSGETSSSRGRKRGTTRRRPRSKAPILPTLDSSWQRPRLRVVPYGVLSARQEATSVLHQAGPALDKNTVIVDQAGAHHVRINQPKTSKAGGASGAIYEFL
eukprot:11128420-Heterocapsa_arctica.AAC.1